eukprot:2747292-Rhodomonas_salina.2
MSSGSSIALRQYRAGYHPTRKTVPAGYHLKGEDSTCRLSCFAQAGACQKRPRDLVGSYSLRSVLRGTGQYARFIRPSRGAKLIMLGSYVRAVKRMRAHQYRSESTVHKALRVVFVPGFVGVPVDGYTRDPGCSMLPLVSMPLFGIGGTTLVSSLLASGSTRASSTVSTGQPAASA